PRPQQGGGRARRHGGLPGPSPSLDGASSLGSDYSDLPLKADHPARPCWTCPDGTIYLEAFHSLYAKAYDFLVAISEPVARPEYLHEYKLTPYSLYAAVATNIDTESIVRVLDRFSKNQLPKGVADFVRECTRRYGKAKLVLKSNRYHVESEHPEVLRELLRDDLISQARVSTDESAGGGDGTNKQQDGKDKDGFVVHTKAEEMEENLRILREMDGDSSDDDEDGEGGKSKKAAAATTVSFVIKAESVEVVKRRAIDLDYPLMEEYDFRNDSANPDVPMDLKPHTRIRRYQERSLSKVRAFIILDRRLRCAEGLLSVLTDVHTQFQMFGNGRARSGIIVLPCGAGKTLTGVTAAQTIKKSVVCLCTNAVSVLQWKYQFQLWTTIPDENICVFTSDRKEDLVPGRPVVLITTYTMMSFSGRRSDKAQEVMESIRGREWGLLLMDEVHVVPAQMFRRVIGTVKAHCRLGVDGDAHLNFLIGPKLYEANWMDLTTQGYLANVQCVEVWCPMTGPFMREYLMANSGRMKQQLYVMNPSKLRATEFLVKFHEERGDKIIVFSDLVYSLKLYAAMLKRPMIYGETSERERQQILGVFRTSE
ncbi:hypothetical protein THAOC_00170, partial [Thalassiosira oceanica]